MMLPTLSVREQKVVSRVNSEILEGDIDPTPVWVDAFTRNFFYGAPGPGEIVDVSCGTGRFIPLLPELCVSAYFGIDPSEESIKYCQKRFGATERILFALDEIRTMGKHYPARFSGFICTAMLIHVPKTDIDIALQSLRTSLVVGAPGLVSVPLAYEDESEELSETGHIISVYSIAELQKVFERNGFMVENIFTPDNFMVLARVTASG